MAAITAPPMPFSPQHGEEDMDVDDNYPIASRLRPRQLQFDHQSQYHVPSNSHDTQDSTMEGGEDTAGSPSPSSGSSGSESPQSVAGDREITVENTSEPPLETLASPSPFAPRQDNMPPPPRPSSGSASTLRPPRASHTSRQAHRDRDREVESDDDEDEGSEVNPGPPRHRDFYPINEDTSSPDAEEERQLAASEEISALDDDHWRSATFFDVDDPEIIPGESTVMDWTIDKFNGTVTDPNKERIMRSPSFSLGGHDWRIKILPHGNQDTDRVSVYIENTSIETLPIVPFASGELPVPLLDGATLNKPNGVAAQISIIIYNPDEPRVHETRTAAHRFTKKSPDHGWSRFTSLPWYELHRRQYAQRQALLRNDKIAVKAYVRIVHDPTECFWTHNDLSTHSTKKLAVNLMPLSAHTPSSAVLALWLHLRPFRKALYHFKTFSRPKSGPVHPVQDTEDVTRLVSTLQLLLYLIRARIDRDSFAVLLAFPEFFSLKAMDDADAVSAMHKIYETLTWFEEPVAAGNFVALEMLEFSFGYVSPFSSARRVLQLDHHADAQSLIDQNFSESDCPEIHAIELARQVFDRQKRCWKKLFNKITLNDRIEINGEPYTLYGLITHRGALQSGVYQPMFRPGGIGGLWYTYGSRSGQCMTRKQAVEAHEGSGAVLEYSGPTAAGAPYFDRYDRDPGQNEAVAYVVLYMRDDIAKTAFDLTAAEPWDLPQWITDEIEKWKSRSDLTKAVDASTGIPRGPGVPEPVPAPLVPPNVPDPVPTDYDDEDMMQSIIADPSATVAAPNTAQFPGWGNADDSPDSDPVTNGADDGTTSYNDDSTDPTLKKVTLNYFSQPYYKGTTLHSTYHGQGHLIALSGDEYTGSFRHGDRHGQGTMIYASGDTYTGSWISDLQDGQGTYTEAKTGNVYSGNWKEGKKFGEGVTKWKVSEEEKKLCRICYESEANAAFYDCGHVVCCHGCAGRVEDCPVCRRRIRDVVKLYYMA